MTFGICAVLFSLLAIPAFTQSNTNYSLEIEPRSVTVAAGGNASLKIQLNAAAGYSQPIYLMPGATPYVLSVSGVKYLIVQAGANDIGNSPDLTADQLVDGYKAMISLAQYCYLRRHHSTLRWAAVFHASARKAAPTSERLHSDRRIV
jgi:hypothetical protein